ncbi:protein SPIRAL1-like 1 [Olea europaea var. sylvestris]|uniref:protein SPIRAL1-like 1 n=1 Tax=Olea europaea var. sylvestris TaxID=158386 RepID=UPI000C1CF3CF|nr:protein SPIRAL1-like 1 [Olea europaea var. sylvestris]
MGRGVSSGGGQSSLGYLFGDGEAPKPATETRAPPSEVRPASKELPQKPNAAAYQSADVSKQIPAGIHSSTANYLRADGQNTANFITVCLY